MFERYLTDALTKHFGHLVENVDAEKVRLSAWNGKLVLEDVILRNDALDSFMEQCPVELAFGKIGRLDVQVPWSLVGAQLWKRKATKGNPEVQDEASGNGGISVILSDVNILITPRRKFQSPQQHSALLDNGEICENVTDDDDDDDEVLRRRKGREQKEKAAQELLDAQLLSRVANSSNTGSRWQWLQDWLSKLLSNLSVTAQNLHIRYEDPGHSMGFVWSSSNPTRGFRRYRKSFAVGLTLGEFSVKTTRQQQKEKHPPKRDMAPEECLTKRLSGKSNEETDATALARPSSPESVPSDDSIEQVGVGQPKEYRIRCKRVTAENLAIYWDGGGCSLISEKSPVDESQAKGKPVLERAYVESAFSELNESGNNATVEDKTCYRKQHTYLLDPVSPSVEFALVTKESFSKAVENDNSGGESISNPPSKIPPSSINITLPPTSFSISRQTLEDTVYLRKSVDVWIHSKKGILSNQSLRRLAKLRPTTSAVTDPQGWWKYAIEATLAFIQVGRAEEAIHGEQNNPPTSSTSTKILRGWLGVARALGRRRRYVSLYQELFASGEEHDDAVYGPILPRQQLQLRTHNLLLELERDLTAPEICAFRISAYFAITGSASNDVASEKSASADTKTTSWEYIEKIISETIRESTSDNSSPALVQRLSLGHRCSMFLEMGQALEREKLNKEIGQQEEEGQYVVPNIGQASDMLVTEPDSSLWEIILSCREMSLQINDRQPVASKRTRGSQGTDSVPVVRLSCACESESNLYLDGSWEVGCTIAALQAEDLAFENQVHVAPDSELHRWRTLVGPKFTCGTGDVLQVDGISFQQSVRLIVRRTFLSSPSNADSKGSSRIWDRTLTRTQVRLFPLEIVYSTVPFEALSRVLATVKTPELADDYHRMAGRVYEWREKQKKRLLQALAHKGKEIIVDVDVTAPVLLVPEAFDRDDSPILVLDLGHLHFSNAPKDNTNVSVSTSFDDAWRLSLNNIQIQSSTGRIHREALRSEGTSTDPVQLQGPQQVVERFSLDISILTQIGEEGDEVRAKVAATLPRLSFNLTSSSVRLLNRLRYRWAKRKDEVERAGIPVSRNGPTVGGAIIQEHRINSNRKYTVSASESSRISMAKKVERVFEFHFSAPLITIGLENDVDGRSVSNVETTSPLTAPSTPIVSLAIHGIAGSLVKKVSKSGSPSTAFDARLQSLIAVDHYQTAGSDYALLVSSLDPANILDNVRVQEQETWSDLLDGEPSLLPSIGKDLVLVEFSSGNDPGHHCSAEPPNDTLSIAFHELYAEWNPETIAAIQKAVRMPPTTALDDVHTSSEFWGTEEEDLDEFFDAEEDVFFDSLAKNSDPTNSELTSPLVKLSRESATALLSSRGSSLSFDASSAASNSFEYDKANTSKVASSFEKTSEIVFNLSKLNVNFNKEARHRRLFTAEMDRTYIQYITRRTGGSTTIARLGNLVFSDPSAADCRTLYSQILGLQTGPNGASTGPVSSLLEMEIVSNPKTREMIRSGLQETPQVDSPVSLCYEDGRVLGCDTYINARFSPMRFVIFLQLWSEIVDYFFEGIMGYEVMGKIPPIVAAKTAVDRGNEGLPDDDSDPCRISFTKFKISIDSPEVLFPVTYRSTQFLKLCAAHIHVTNDFDCNRDNSCGDVARWHNNCKIRFESLRMFSWDGKDISHSSRNLGANIHVRWPIGPLAPSETPKWDVRCNLERLYFSLRRDDYALLQSIISFNIGEPTRHFDEWDALQNLTAKQLEHYKENVMVHFGYDKKDVAPTTYQITLKMPLVKVSLETESGTSVGVARCSHFSWGLTKLADRISCQKVTCAMDLVHPKPDNETETLLSFNQPDRTKGEEAILPELTYSSTSKPCGDNVKTLDIVNPCIYLVYPAWKALMSFFTGLPEVEVLSAEEVSNSVQVGDRWYKISASSAVDNNHGIEGTNATAIGKRFSWIDSRAGSPKSNGEQFLQHPSFQLRVTLSSPCILLSSANSADSASVVLRLGHLDLLHTRNGEEGATTKSFLLHDLELYTSSHGNGGRNSDSSENSLIHPWCLSGVIQSCSSERPCNCESHSIRLGADVLRASAAFSVMMIAIEVCLSFLADFRQCTTEGEHSERPKTRYSDSTQPSLNEGPSRQFPQELPATPKQYVVALDWNGFEFLVVDDSGRHFAGSQELITLVLGNILFLRQDNKLAPKSTGQSGKATRQDQFSHKMTVQLHSIDLLDCLQPEGSPFRRLISSPSGKHTENRDPKAMIQSSKKSMDWNTFAMQESDEWGFSASPALIERTDTAYAALVTSSIPALKEETGAVSFSSFDDDGDTRSYRVKVRSSSVQYNPSTVIALQRFLGRFRKQAVQSLEVFNEEIDKFVKASYESHAAEDKDAVSSQGTNTKADIELESLSISLNKEHQRRRLLKVDLTGCHTTLSSDKTGVTLEGSVRDLSAWDCDQQASSAGRQFPNTCVLRVLRNESTRSPAKALDDSFLNFRFSTFRKDESVPIERNIPHWVRSHITGNDVTGQEIDDCLEVSLCTIELTYLRERTEEILDYLSNGLPGKGMGATKFAAQGFLKKRIETRSFLQLRVESPTVYLPEEELAVCGIRIRLGTLL